MSNLDAGMDLILGPIAHAHELGSFAYITIEFTHWAGNASTGGALTCCKKENVRFEREAGRASLLLSFQSSPIPSDRRFS